MTMGPEPSHEEPQGTEENTGAIPKFNTKIDNFGCTKLTPGSAKV